MKASLALALGSALALVQAADPLDRRSKGARDAPVTVYEMADFQCPACRGFALTIFPVLEREFIATGKVRWVFINFPLTSIHPNAVAAADVAMCAARQGRFWETHDLLFQDQRSWASLTDPGPTLLALGERAGANRAALAACVQSRAVRADIEADAGRSRRAGAKATPSFYIHGGILEGAPTTPQPFRQLLDSIYAARAPRAAAPR